MKNSNVKQWIMVLMLIVGGTGLASAAAESQAGLNVAKRVFAAQNPADAYKGLSEAERKSFHDATMPKATTHTTAVAPMKAAAAAGNCWNVRQTWERKNVLGNTLYTYWQTTAVCIRNKKISKVKVQDAGGETGTPGWRIAKKPTVSTKNVQWEGRGKAAFHFVLGAGPWDLAHPSDCIQLRLNKNGHSYQSSKSCDLGS
jgi:hypothetical protein